MAELTQYQIYELINRPGPLWLRNIDLSGVDLSKANLRGANLRGAIGDGNIIRTVQSGKYHIVITESMMAIGCEQHSIDDWFLFTDKQIIEMDGKEALQWWRKWKPILLQIMEGY